MEGRNQEKNFFLKQEKGNGNSYLFLLREIKIKNLTLINDVLTYERSLAE